MRKQRAHSVLAGCLAAFGVAMMIPMSNAATESAETTATVSANFNKTLATVPTTALGMNTATWDGNLYTPQVPGALQDLKVKVLRWPGGSYSDTYDWRTAPFEFDQFVELAKQVGAEPILTVNYGSGSPQEAASWVKYANVTHHDHIKYWEIGNEVYGDGEYQGVTWEQDYHSQKGPAAYGKNALKFITAMRKVDPTIQIGVVATIPGVWPSDIQPYWDRTLLPIVAKNIDFIVVHWYPQNPGQESDSTLLSDSNVVAGYMSQLHQYLQSVGGKYAKHIQVFVDETNSVSSNPGKQSVSVVNALFLAQDYNSWLQNGAENVSWWTLHNNGLSGNNDSTSLYGSADFGDYGILSNGDPMEPPLNTRFPVFYGYKLVSDFIQPGDQYVTTSSSRPDLSVYAAKGKNHSAGMMLVNTNPKTSYLVQVQGFDTYRGKRLVVESYGAKTKHITTVHETFTGEVKVPPYSIVLMQMQ